MSRRLRGDLDVIALTALRKEPERRYRSAEQMAEDIRRHLDGLPIAAQTDTFGYRAGKFVRRHAIGVAMSTAAMLLVSTAAIALAIQSAIAARERDEAQQVASLLVDVFEVADLSEARGAQVTAREVLDRGVTRIERLTDQPDVQGHLLAVLGRVYRNLGLYERASAITARAAKSRESVQPRPGGSDPGPPRRGARVARRSPRDSPHGAGAAASTGRADPEQSRPARRSHRRSRSARGSGNRQPAAGSRQPARLRSRSAGEIRQPQSGNRPPAA